MKTNAGTVIGICLDINRNRVASDMLRKKLPLSLIADISRLSEDTIRSIAHSLGLTTH